MARRSAKPAGGITPLPPADEASSTMPFPPDLPGIMRHPTPPQPHGLKRRTAPEADESRACGAACTCQQLGYGPAVDVPL